MARGDAVKEAQEWELEVALQETHWHQYLQHTKLT